MVGEMNLLKSRRKNMVGEMDLLKSRRKLVTGKKKKTNEPL
jgi:hypothetical protein